MSHMVIHTPADGTTQYRQFDDLASAVQFVEEQRNAGVDDASLFEMREIALEVKSYFKVEVADAAAPAPVVPMPTVESTAPAPAPVAEAPEPVAPVLAAPADDLSYVEAAMSSPIDAFATEAAPLGDLALSDSAEMPAEVPAAPSSEGRRGLFGR